MHPLPFNSSSSTQRLLMDHVEGKGERKLEPSLQEIHERRAGLYAGGERAEEQIEPSAEGSDWPGEYQQE
jgi:hypothetical protein